MTRPPWWTLLVLVGCVPEIELDAEGKAPTASMLSPTDGATVPKGRFVAEGRVSDLQDPPSRLFVVWSLRDVDGAWRDVCDDFAQEDGATRCLTTVNPTDDAVRLRVTDLAGFQKDVLHQLVVADVSAPVVVLSGPDPEDGPLVADRAVPFEAAVTDEQDAAPALALTWRSDIQGVLDGPSMLPSSGPLRAALSLREGLHQVSLEARDPFGLIGQDAVTVLVGGDNQPPSCRLNAPVDGAVGPTGGTWEITGFGRDPEWGAQGMAVEVRSDRDGVLDSLALPAGSVFETSVVLSKGAHQLTVELEDHVGASCVRTVSVVVDDPPSLSVTSPAPDLVLTAGSYLAIDATLSHPTHAAEDLVLQVTSSLSGDLGSWSADAEGRVEATRSIAAGNHRLMFVAEDPEGLRSLEVVRDIAVGAVAP